MPPSIQTYHCICTSLLLSTTHTLSSLPRRTTSTGGLDAALILPLPASPPSQLPPDSETYNEGGDPRDQEGGGEEQQENPQSQSQSQPQSTQPLPEEGYTILLGLDPDRKITLIRREDGFEKRLLYRCSRCRLVVGYALGGPSSEEGEQGEAMDVDADVKGKGIGTEKEKGGYKGKVIYLLPGGIMSTGVMAKGGDLGAGRRIGEEDVGIKAGEGGGVFE